MDTYKILKDRFLELVVQNSWQNEQLQVTVKTLTPEEAIGNPEHDDYPLVKGRERMMQARFKDSFGQAFSDMYGLYGGTLMDVAESELTNNYRRAIFVAALNAVMRHLGMVERTIHCKDGAPPKCAKELVSFIQSEFNNPKIAMIGLQPRMVEALAEHFPIRVTDMDQKNIGTEKFGVVIDHPDREPENLAWSDVALVTGTVFTNDSLQEILKKKMTVFYGVTVAGPAHMLNLRRFCPYGE